MVPFFRTTGVYDVFCNGKQNVEQVDEIGMEQNSILCNGHCPYTSTTRGWNYIFSCGGLCFNKIHLAFSDNYEKAE